MFKSPKAPKVSMPKITAPKIPIMPAEHIAKQFQAVHPDNTATSGLKDMFEVQRRQTALTKDFAGTL